jgi:hypothetical protein
LADLFQLTGEQRARASTMADVARRRPCVGIDPSLAEALGVHCGESRSPSLGRWMSGGDWVKRRGGFGLM